jgi:predicted DNA-binding helix-hairpin-helix protein
MVLESGIVSQYIRQSYRYAAGGLEVLDKLLCVYRFRNYLHLFHVPETVNKSIEELAFLFEDDAHAEQTKRVREQAEEGQKDTKVVV